MIIQISSDQGPAECELAVCKLFESLKKDISIEYLRDTARDIGPNTFELVRRIFDESKIVHQPMQTVKSILSIADEFTPGILDKACEKAMIQRNLKGLSMK